MTTATAVWLYLAASGLLAAWVMLRLPNLRPRTFVAAFALFLSGQLTPLVGLVVLPVALRLADGPQVALPLVVLPSFFVAWLTIGWLLWMFVDSVRAPRGPARRTGV